MLTSTEEFLNTLPQNYRDQARSLRSREEFERNQIIGGNLLEVLYPFDSNSIYNSRQRNTKPKKSKSNVKEPFYPIKDKHLIQKLILADEKFIESILSLLFTDSLTFSKFPFSLLKSIMMHPVNEFKIKDSFLFLLKIENLDNFQIETNSIFPCFYLYEKNSFIKNYQTIYMEISLKILFIFTKFTQSCNSFFLENDGKKTKKSLNCIQIYKNKLKIEYQNPLYILISLLSKKCFLKSFPHLRLIFDFFFFINNFKINYHDNS